MSRTKILTTFGTGPAREALAISLPLMARYAQRHGYRLVVPSDAEVNLLCHGRPASWGKVAWLKQLSRESVESTVLWLDADVVVCRPDVDIAGDDPAALPFVSMAVQNTPDGAVPSCGVMLINNDANSYYYLQECYHAIWKACGPDGMNAVRSSGWWEQAAMIRWLGGDPDPTPIVTPPPSNKWGELAYEWNPHPCDPRGIPDDLRFFHATATDDRFGDMRRWAQRAETQ
jgi:hypothetical protein